MKPCGAWLLLAGLSMAVTAAASDTDLLHKLGGVEWRLDEARWRGLAEDPTPGLIAIVKDAATLPHVRARAIAVLSLFPGPAVWGLYQDLLKREDPIAMRRIVDALCAGFVQTRPDAVESLLGGFLDRPDAQLRLRSAACLQTIGTESALAMVQRYRERLDSTGEAWERTSLQSLTR